MALSLDEFLKNVEKTDAEGFKFYGRKYWVKYWLDMVDTEHSLERLKIIFDELASPMTELKLKIPKTNYFKYLNINLSSFLFNFFDNTDVDEVYANADVVDLFKLLKDFNYNYTVTLNYSAPKGYNHIGDAFNVKINQLKLNRDLIPKECLLMHHRSDNWSILKFSGLSKWYESQNSIRDALRKSLDIEVGEIEK